MFKNSTGIVFLSLVVGSTHARSNLMAGTHSHVNPSNATHVVELAEFTVFTDVHFGGAEASRECGLRVRACVRACVHGAICPENGPAFSVSGSKTNYSHHNVEVLYPKSSSSFPSLVPLFSFLLPVSYF